MQEEAISVHGDEILASAWDVGAQFSLDHGTTSAGQSTERALIPPLANPWVGVLQWNASGFQGFGPQLPFPPTWITKFNFGTNTPPIVIAGGFPAAPQGGPNLQISIGGAAWSEIGGLLPTDIIRVVTDRPLDNEVYVLTASGRVFAKPQSLVAMGDNGLWTELTGNLTVAGSNGSAVFFNTILGDPFHYSVFVGTSNGVYKTTNNCVRTKRTCVWQPWGDGLPVHPASVEANGTITSIANGDPGTAVHQLVGQVRSDGRYYVYAATWERGVWVRDAMGDDP